MERQQAPRRGLWQGRWALRLEWSLARSSAGWLEKGIAEKIDPTVESAYWRENYISRPYAGQNARWEDYEPAYRTGYEGYGRHRGRRFDDVEAELRSSYERARGGSSLQRDKARYAARDAWDRVERQIPGDADRDGR